MVKVPGRPSANDKPASKKKVIKSNQKGQPVKKVDASKKLRIGIIVGKDFDPCKKGNEGPDFPDHLSLTDAEWGKYSVDAVTALRMARLHPDIMHIDIIQGKDLTRARCRKNHVNINFWYEISVSMLSKNTKHIDEVIKCHKDPSCRVAPSWDYYDWVMCKPRYMKQCIKAGVPLIPTVFYDDGFDPKQCMKDVQKMGWDKFFVKEGYMALFGNGAINGKTADFLGPRAKDLEMYAKETKKSKVFLLQPYMLKPNGEVFDEVRNFFIDGEWHYSVFTHGTDETDAGYFEEPDGPRKVACKALAERAYQEILKTATWQGKKMTPLLNRIDIGVMPKKGACSLHKTDNTYFVNEIETAMTTWLDRYAPCSVSDIMAHKTTKHSLELLVGLIKAKKKVPDKANVIKLLKVLNARVGPFKNINI